MAYGVLATPMLTRAARLGRIAFTDDMQFFPQAQTLVNQHLHPRIAQRGGKE